MEHIKCMSYMTSLVVSGVKHHNLNPNPYVKSQHYRK